MPNNKVKFGLKNVYIAKATIADDGSATYDTPFALRGAVNLSLDAQGDVTKFRADNIDYWVGYANSGYEGDLELALVTDEFKTKILNMIVDDNGVMVEDVGAQPEHFAMMFQFEGDQKATRHVLYNVSVSRPQVAGATTEENIEPQTESLSLTATSAHFTELDKDLVKASCSEEESSVYAAWFDAVYQPEITETDPADDPVDPQDPQDPQDPTDPTDPVDPENP